jgi:hypothetical protein
VTTRGKCIQLPIDSGVLSTELRIVHQLELATEDFECGPTRGIRAPLTRFTKLRNVHESTFGTFYSASYVHDGVLSPNTEDGHDYAMRSNRRMHQPRHPSEDHGATESHLLWSFGLSHKTLKDFSNTVPFHLSKAIGSGDFQLSRSIVSGVALGRCRHFY